ncbi:MAG: tRNA (guanosine(37)-N1)-methyltransferase TrmD [Candidatus Omnitrophota bacterium]
MRIEILTLFPGMFQGVFDESMIKIAQKKNLVEIKIHNLRKWTKDRHRTADDKPYGGGPGMVLKVEPVDKALTELKQGEGQCPTPVVILLTPQGEKFKQSLAKRALAYEHIILICGHYEGFDERIRGLVDMEISMGDYILTCGEVPAMIFCDAVIRLIPGVLGGKDCLQDESFEDGLLEYPQYTRPAEYKGMKVPDILLSGDPKKIKIWRNQQALKRTRERRPDLLGSD